VQVINKRNWTEIETQIEARLPAVDTNHRKLLAELNAALAKALLHLGRSSDKVIAACDVRAPTTALLLRALMPGFACFVRTVVQLCVPVTLPVTCTLPEAGLPACCCMRHAMLRARSPSRGRTT
jgi:hypothetical protein